MTQWKTILFSRTFQYPVLAMVLLVAISAWYYRVAVRRSEAGVNERSLRVLAALADEFSSHLATLNYIGHQNWRSNELPGQVPELEAETCDSVMTAEPETKLSFSGYQLSLVVGLAHPDSTKSGAVTVKAKEWLHSCWSISYQGFMYSLERSLPKGVFEDLLLANAGGRVLYQTQRSGMKVDDLHPFYEETRQQGNRTKGKQEEKQTTVGKDANKLTKSDDQESESTEKGEELAISLSTSKLRDVDLGGGHYKLYTVPVRVPVRMNNSAPMDFIVGGILRERTFQSERVTPLANTLVTIGFFVLLVAVGTYPILRFRLMGSAEVLKQRTGFVFVLQLVFTAILLGGLAGHLMFSHYGAETDDELQRLAAQIESNVAVETGLALDMLGSLEKFYLDSHPQVRDSIIPSTTTCSDDLDPQILVKLTLPADDLHWTPEILKYIKQPTYPYFDNVSFADRAGVQEIKFSARSSVTPAVRVCDSDAFKNVLHANDLWQLRGRDDSFSIEPMYTKTSGRYLALLSRAVSKELQKRAVVAVIATELVSVSHPIFPPDYGFAIVDHEGEVLFHSTPAKNRRENFADACGRSRRIRDLFATRESETLETSYLGIRHRISVRPLRAFENCPWSIVTFRDLTNLEEDHFDSVLMFLFLSGNYFIVIVIVSLGVGIAKRPPEWIWPSERRLSEYWSIFGMLTFLTVFNTWLLFHCDGTELWVTAFTIPLAAVIFTVLKLRAKERIMPYVSVALWLIGAALLISHRERSIQFWLAFTGICTAFAGVALPLGRLRAKIGHGSLSTVYALAGTALLFTVGFIPAIRLFNASVLFQNVVAARRSQLELAERFEERRERINHAYEESASAKFLPQRRDQEIKDLYYLDLSLPSPGAGSEYLPQHLDPLLLSVASTVLKHDGSSPKHRSGLTGRDEAREWCEAGPFPKANLLLRIDKAEERCKVLEGEQSRDYHNRWIVSTLPQQVLPGLDSRSDPFVSVESLLIFVVLIAAFFGLRYTIERLFALNWRPPKEWLGVQISSLDLRDPRLGHHTVLLGVPCSSKTEALRHHSGIHYIDLVNCTKDRTKDPVLLSEDVVVLDHFEYDLDSALQRGRKLHLLERLIFQVKCKVVIATTIDPLYYFDQMAARRASLENARDYTLDVERWTKVLANFHVVQIENPSSIKGKQYFALLWQTCALEERAALHQIAKHTWANYLQEPALTHLFQRGLIIHDPMFEVIDPNFADYIRRSFNDDHFVIREEGGTSDMLSALRIVFVVAGIAFIAALAYIWGDQMVAYVATGASAVTAATRALAKSKGRGTAGADV